MAALSGAVTVERGASRVKRARSADRTARPLFGERFGPDQQEALESLKHRRDIDRAFAVLIEPNRAGLFSFLLHKCRNRSDAQELLQETFLASYDCINRFEPEHGTLLNWLKGIAENCWLKMCRDRYRGEDAVAALAEQSPNSCEGPDVVLARRERKEAVWKMLSRLDPIDALIAAMHWMDEMTHEEIGSVLHMPVGTVKQHALRAEHLLRAQALIEPLPSIPGEA
jgi:RNA polymerase sigma-70 factor (ECF subfamily)